MVSTDLSLTVTPMTGIARTVEMVYSTPSAVGRSEYQSNCIFKISQELLFIVVATEVASTA